jgi:hypothetical protein
MTDANVRREREALTGKERTAASVAAVVLFGIALWMILDPPGRTVALGGCKSAADGCLVTVDSDMTTIAAAVFALAAVAGLIAILGVRFTSVKAAGVELSQYEKKTAGLPTVEEQQREAGDGEGKKDTPGLPTVAEQQSRGDGESEKDTQGRRVTGDEVEHTADSPVRLEVRTGLGTELGVVPVPVASLDSPMNESQARFLRDYQIALRKSQNGWFLTHILGPAKSPRQKYSVAVKVTPHPRDAEGDVIAARFFFGRAWGYRVFEGLRGADGRFGCTTEAYGPFLALCEVEFATGELVLLDHYCDFEMGALVAD